MRMPFTKMHALGNDFMVVRADGRTLPKSDRITLLADRHTGVGFDQFLWLEPPRTEGGDLYYRIFNSDGSEAEQCGNGARCIARLTAGELPRTLTLEHAGGVMAARIEADGQVTVDMGVPEFEPDSIPFIADEPREIYELNVGDDTVAVSVVSMGNPHAVLQVKSVEDAPVQTLGPLLESHDRFPNRANISFMQAVAPDRIKLRVFERGVGETKGCGTGACAATVVGHRSGQLDDRVVVELPGGAVTICWKGPGTPVWLTGEAITVFEGTVDL